MQKKLTAFVLLSFLAITLSGCSSSGTCKIMAFWPQKPTISNTCPHERQYVVYGRVLNNQCTPIENCKVVLIKRKYDFCANKQGATLAELPIAMTDKTGDYTFCFEPLGANDVWIYFDAKDKGYVPQFIELNHLMGPTFLQTPGNSPVIVDMVLEKPI